MVNEKKKDVPVNKVIWWATGVSTVMYLTFSVMGAASFANISDNALQILASSQVRIFTLLDIATFADQFMFVQVHLFTRICAAVFGVAIIASGVPIFSIMMHDSLYYSGICAANMALFMLVLSYLVNLCISFFLYRGGFVPYLISWTLYQGHFLMNVLNWAGLVVNGFVAFIFPLFLTLFAIQWIKKTQDPNYVPSAAADKNGREAGPTSGFSRANVRYSNGNFYQGAGPEDHDHDEILSHSDSDEDDVSLDSVELEMVTFNHQVHSDTDNEDDEEETHGHDHSHHDHGHHHSHAHEREEDGHHHHVHHDDHHHHFHDKPVIGLSGYVAKLCQPQPEKHVILFQRNIVQPLFCCGGFFEPYREIIVKVILVLFITVVASNIVIDWISGIQP
jgi:hypothetical protein